VDAAGQDTRLGRYMTTAVGGEQVHAFVPPPLPPVPPIRMEGLLSLLEEANRAVGRLDGMTSILPDPPLFIYMYVRKEALLSSQIEGTQSSLSDLLLYENEEVPGVPLDDVQEVSNYVAAMTHGLERLRGDFPLSLRLIREIHHVLLSRGRGSDKEPGEFRRSQNWVGGTRPGNALYVPPPPNLVMECMGNFETFLHTKTPDIPLLVKAALVHLQFESIHPFLDGNGRLGRLLITFLLCAEGALHEPSLYLSLYFKTHRRQYYDLLQQVREEGAWETWLDFFLTGVKETSEQATATARRILALFAEDRSRIETLGRKTPSALRLHQLLQTRPITSIPAAAKRLGVTQPTISKSIEELVGLGIVREVTGRQRDRVYAYDRYITILNEGTEPLS
jgi:Fic family protein